MPQKRIKILSWNVEHFRNDQHKIDSVTNMLKKHDPDVFAIYEVEAGSIYDILLDEFPSHSGFLTTGQQSQEIFVACRNTFEGIKFEQKDKFKSGNPYLRPGVFLTFKYPEGAMYGFLFLHTDSGTDAVDFGNRNEMFEHAFNLKRKLDHINNNEPSNFMIMCDLNTMGLKYPKQIVSDIIAETDHEIDYIDYESGRKGSYSLRPNMRRLTKPAGTFFYRRNRYSDLDHIIASEHMNFKNQQNKGVAGTFEILLDGWRSLDDENDRENYAKNVSDHCLLMCELNV